MPDTRIAHASMLPQRKHRQPRLTTLGLSPMSLSRGSSPRRMSRGCSQATLLRLPLKQSSSMRIFLLLQPREVRGQTGGVWQAVCGGDLAADWAAVATACGLPLPTAPPMAAVPAFPDCCTCGDSNCSNCSRQQPRGRTFCGGRRRSGGPSASRPPPLPPQGTPHSASSGPHLPAASPPSCWPAPGPA
jgi:hypothetical protein